MKKIVLALSLAVLSAAAVFIFQRRLHSHRSASATPQPAVPAHDDIAHEAYLIAMEHQSRGEPSDPDRDWTEAEQRLTLYFAAP